MLRIALLEPATALNAYARGVGVASTEKMADLVGEDIFRGKERYWNDGDAMIGSDTAAKAFGR